MCAVISLSLIAQAQGPDGSSASGEGSAPAEGSGFDEPSAVESGSAEIEGIALPQESAPAPIASKEPEEKSETRLGIVRGDALRVRSKPDTSTNDNILGYLNTGDMVTILEETTVAKTLWYKVTCKVESGKTVTGYVSADYVNVVTESGDFEEYLDDQRFPESYKDYLRALHAEHPNWIFQAVQTGLSWDTVIKEESVVGRNLVPRDSNSAYINHSDVDSSGRQIGRDGSYWVAASTAAVSYYMDPRNFLNESYIFQFESLAYSDQAHTEAGVEAILKGTFMDKSHTFTADKKKYTYAQAFMEAGKELGVSPYHLASRVRQEQGTTGTRLSAGTVPDYKGYYNYFNIGAYTTSSHSAEVNGALYAKNVSSGYYGPWTDPLRSIKGGGKILASGYILNGQDTMYFQKFNVVTKPYYTNQYMTNVMAPASEGITMKQAYGDDPDIAVVFRIPVYKNMPDSAVPRPENQTTEKPATKPSKPEAPVDPPGDTTPKISSETYKISSGTVTQVAEKTTASALLKGIDVEDGYLRVVDKTGAEKTSKKLVTGDVLQVLYLETRGVYKNYTIVIYGDVSGDGVCDVLDLLRVQKHLLKIQKQSGAYLTACDVTKDGKVDILDLLRVQKHLLGIMEIVQ